MCKRITMVIAEPGTIARVVEDLRWLRAGQGQGLRAFAVPAFAVI